MHDPIAEKTKFYQVEYGDVFTDLGLVNSDGTQFAYEGPFRLVNAKGQRPRPILAQEHRIFDPFFTAKAVGKSTGVGLSLCYGIIQKMGGTIEVGSQMGQGISFLIRLPVKVRQTAKPSTRKTTNNI
ncbi:hypothetical protein DO021_00695 [Desulfobacter hydrogenophilus]|uniref:histidine kinase n=1 Tax=Desulfobacter hydrogenophilus TaxID=2291 RepID=A0A328FL61_9BACT|nr:ATP-binding protein [Desulfobacter hydrogenophilus]NDY72758.1 HAMP domain-containing histidine kinase [Desulfobacter hydrogenophilus]QBH12989.1 HAMP domain-containing histidine kinase [Desulfobacter hydrogenophilus]RAM03973.1 hypothetical protein DO021_00695 [Desulfobacter hydrogenophilus]